MTDTIKKVLVVSEVAGLQVQLGHDGKFQIRGGSMVENAVILPGEYVQLLRNQNAKNWVVNHMTTRKPPTLDEVVQQLQMADVDDYDVRIVARRMYSLFGFDPPAPQPKKEFDD